MLLQELLVIKKRSLFQSLCQWMETIENARGQVTSGVWERKGVAGPRSRSSPARFYWTWTWNRQQEMKFTYGPWQAIVTCKSTIKVCQLVPGAIIGNGDRKRAPFLVLGLSLWYGTIFLFLEQIAPSPAAHARTCCEDFCGCSAGKWRPKFAKCLMLLAHNSIPSCLLEFCFSVFVVSCSSLSEARQCQI